MRTSIYHLATLADRAVPALRRLADDPEHPTLREAAISAVESLGDAVEDIASQVDIMLSPLPRCPVGGLTSLAIGGGLGRAVTSEECRRWALDLDGWADAIDRLA